MRPIAARLASAFLAMKVHLHTIEEAGKALDDVTTERDDLREEVKVLEGHLKTANKNMSLQIGETFRLTRELEDRRTLTDSMIRKIIFWAVTSTFTHPVNEGARIALSELGYEICNQCKGRGTVWPTRAICGHCQGLGATRRTDA